MRFSAKKALKLLLRETDSDSESDAENNGGEPTCSATQNDDNNLRNDCDSDENNDYSETEEDEPDEEQLVLGPSTENCSRETFIFGA